MKKREKYKVYWAGGIFRCLWLTVILIIIPPLFVLFCFGVGDLFNNDLSHICNDVLNFPKDILIAETGFIALFLINDYIKFKKDNASKINKFFDELYKNYSSNLKKASISCVKWICKKIVVGDIVELVCLVVITIYYHMHPEDNMPWMQDALRAFVIVGIVLCAFSTYLWDCTHYIKVHYRKKS